MPHRRWKIRTGLALAGALAVASLTACGSVEVTPSGESSSTTAAPSSTPGAATGDAAISDATAAQLCDMLRPELSNFRVQGPTLGRLSLNAMVLDWTVRNAGLGQQVLADKKVIDRVTTKSCADVRTEALTALELPDLASGLVL
ncbi:hypothetical protein [Nocardia asteroides]|uniref:hypothetical protein n=1 Tax=Nocardia asteroides TaxID=1824 RepID=UPI001E617588|nr:hypothetical protein [Nocardia asteroides]UGT54360.1 hypothetical protein LTT85_27560 [Nocardia asteroides]